MRVVAQPAPIGAVGYPQNAVLVDLWIAEALAVGGRRTGRWADFDELVGFGVEAAELAGALRHPGIALWVGRHVVRFGIMVDEIVGDGTIFRRLAGEQFARQAAIVAIGLIRLEARGR